MENITKFIVAKFVLVLLVSTITARSIFDVTKEGAKIEADINQVNTCLMQFKICIDKNLSSHLINVVPNYFSL